MIMVTIGSYYNNTTVPNDIHIIILSSVEIQSCSTPLYPITIFALTKQSLEWQRNCCRLFMESKKGKLIIMFYGRYNARLNKLDRFFTLMIQSDSNTKPLENMSLLMDPVSILKLIAEEDAKSLDNSNFMLFKMDITQKTHYSNSFLH